jgi:hypothetical protein
MECRITLIWTGITKTEPRMRTIQGPPNLCELIKVMTVSSSHPITPSLKEP